MAERRTAGFVESAHKHTHTARQLDSRLSAAAAKAAATFSLLLSAALAAASSASTRSFLKYTHTLFDAIRAAVRSTRLKFRCTLLSRGSTAYKGQMHPMVRGPVEIWFEVCGERVVNLT